MPSPLSSTKALAKLAQVATKLNALSLPAKIMELRHSRSEDRTQQLQSEAIVELYDAVKQLQEAIWPMLVLIPDVEAVRQAAQAAGSTASAPALSSAAARLAPGPRFTR